jgi:hypothetical protein
MENKLPTAKEFLKSFANIKEISTEQLMIAFAKLHVKAAIKECIKSAPSGSSTDTVSYEDVVYALKDCYPLKNIK